jgi:hypothetical protein
VVFSALFMAFGAGQYLAREGHFIRGLAQASDEYYPGKPVVKGVYIDYVLGTEKRKDRGADWTVTVLVDRPIDKFYLRRNNGALLYFNAK